MTGGVIYTRIRRPPPDLLKQYRDIPSTIVSDAMNRSNAMHAEIKPVSAGTSLVGPAVTVKAMVGCNIMSHKAIYVARPGDVIVFDARGHKDTSVWGFLQTKACMLRGIAGVVIDGSIRDSREIRESGFPLFCRGVTPAGPHKGWGDSINVPIQCGGVKVDPGDIVVGDDDGVIVVPRKEAAEILKRARACLRREQQWFEDLADGKSTLEILGLEKKIKGMEVDVL